MTERTEVSARPTFEQIQDLMGEILRKSSRREGICLYRGEPECYPIVSSTLYRKCPDCRNEAFDIARLENEIVQHARQFTTVADDNEILAEIQHFGGSTNLLDFTDDYLIALFFACADKQKEDGRVVLHWPNSDAVVRPKQTNNRVVFQKSVFVRPQRGFIVPDDADETVVVPSRLKKSILPFLARFHGISERSVYSDIHGYIRHQNPSRSRYVAELRETLAKLQRDPGFDLGPYVAAKLDRVELVRMRHYCHQKGMDYVDGAMTEFAIRTADEALGSVRPHTVELKPDDVIHLFTHCIDNGLDCSRLQNAYCRRGEALLFQGSIDLALRDFRKALEMNADLADAYHGRAGVHSQHGNTDRAIEDLSKALHLKPVLPAALIDRGNLHRDNGSLGDAIEDFNAAMAGSRSGSRYTWFRDAHFYRGLARCIQRDWPAAECDLECARREGLRVASSFRNIFGSVAKFEADYNLKIPSLITTQLYLA